MRTLTSLVKVWRLKPHPSLVEAELERERLKFTGKLEDLAGKVMSNHVFQLFGYDVADKLVSSQVVLEAPDLAKGNESGFMTAGVNLDEVLVDFLTEHSGTFKSFRVIDQALQLTTVNYQLDAFDSEGAQHRLNAIFFISDCHRNQSDLVKYVGKVQTYKAVSFALPLIVHEEIVEKDKAGITRYCVIYELLDSQRSRELKSLSQLCETWNLDAGNAKEVFSLEKCYYLILKLMHLLG
jgi:hypothetical protein